MRLSIIDLSKDGHQPFSSPDGRYQMTYNGEIFNYIELREELEKAGETFKTKTDTEVLLRMYMRGGAECLLKLNGFFAFAIYDTQRGEIFLARDRFGIKPLYYAQYKGSLYFSSEIKALRHIKKIPFQVNEEALFDYLCFNRTDVFDETFDTQVKRIPKGHYGVFDIDGLRVSQWWNPADYAKKLTTSSQEEICKRV